MSSCGASERSCCGTNTYFSRWSRKYAKRFERRGLDRAQKYLLEGIAGESVAGRSVLDIGCGIGSIHHSLLRQGAAKSLGVDLSEGMILKARQLAERLHLDNRAEYAVGDFTELASSVPDSDITILDKVVCCYEDVAALVRSSTAKTRHTLALTHPKENLLMKGMFLGHIVLARIFRLEFRPYWHDWTWMRSLVQSQGFQLLFERSTITWQVLVFRRS